MSINIGHARGGHISLSQLSIHRSNKSRKYKNMLWTSFFNKVYFNIYLIEIDKILRVHMNRNANISYIYNFHIGGQTKKIFVHISCISRGNIVGPILIEMKNISFFFILKFLFGF